MYILEINHINPRENLFFHQTDIVTQEQIEELMVPVYRKHHNQGSWDKEITIPIGNFKNFQRPTGEWQYVTHIGGFVSISAAVDFFKDITSDGTEYRRIRRAWHQEHGILNETNILDKNGNKVESIHACQAHKCIRFGSCPSQGSGCVTVPENASDGIYPIYHTKVI